MKRNKKFILLFLPFLLLGVSVGTFTILIRYNNHVLSDKQLESSNHSEVQGANTVLISSFDRLQYSTTDLTSPWTIISSSNQIPKNYKPDDLLSLQSATGAKILVRTELARRAEAMLGAATKENLNIKAISGYRDYYEQQQLYLSRKDKTAAKPGFSEHQLGIAIDVSTGDNENIWLANHAHKYGFIIRYPKGKESITGMAYEPWHLRYVGVELATEIKNSNKTLEEYFQN